MKKLVPLILLSATLIAVTSFKAPAEKKVVTITFNVDPADWKAAGADGAPGSYMVYRYNNDTLTNDVFNNAMVMVYVLGTSGGGWYPLPQTYYGAKGNVTTTFNYKPGYVELRDYNSKYKLGAPAITMRYKLVIMPG